MADARDDNTQPKCPCMVTGKTCGNDTQGYPFCWWCEFNCQMAINIAAIWRGTFMRSGRRWGR